MKNEGFSIKILNGDLEQYIETCMDDYIPKPVVSQEFSHNFISQKIEV